MLDAARVTVADRVSRLAELTPGRTGNLSVRRGDRVAVTPSGVPYREIEPGDVPVVGLDGEQLFGDREPSSETPLHRRLYRAFDAGAIVHTHSPWATTLATLREPVRAVHYVLALAGGTVPVAEYATYGTEELAASAVAAMDEAGTSACLLANHGLVATGADADAALETAVAVESVARLDCQARAVGSPHVLSDDELERVAAKFESYGPDERAGTGDGGGTDEGAGPDG